MIKEITKEKIIYASRIGLSNKELNEILNLEVNYHLRNNPGFRFFMVGENPVKNKDKSVTFKLHFIKNVEEPVPA